MGVHGVLYCVLYERSLPFVGDTHVPGCSGWVEGWHSEAVVLSSPELSKSAHSSIGCGFGV